MSDVAIRDRLLAYALLGYITPACARLLIDFGCLCNASASLIRQGLRIDDPKRVQEVREPLTVERMQCGLETYRDAALTLADYLELLRQLPDPPFARTYFALRTRHAPEAEVDALIERTLPEMTARLHAARYPDTVGAFEGAASEACGLFRPETDCTMFTLRSDHFCAVCRRAILAAIRRRIE
jgi:hypothetical protein